MLEANNLSKILPPSRCIFENVSFCLSPQERVCLVGPTGSGKSLFLKSLVMLVPTDTGTVYWKNSPVTKSLIPQFRSQVHYISQFPVLHTGTVEESWKKPFSFQIYKGRNRWDEKFLDEILETLNLDRGFLNKKAAQLSGGEHQLAKIIGSLLLYPEFLLLDEPTSALDEKSKIRVEVLLNKYMAGGPRALLWVTHDSSQARRMGQKILTLQNKNLQKVHEDEKVYPLS